MGLTSGGHSWSETQALCRDQDPRSQLVSVHSSEEHRALYDIVEAGLGGDTNTELSFWLGGQSEAINESIDQSEAINASTVDPSEAWTWSDGSPWGWAAWLQGQPSVSGRGQQMCVKTRRVRGVAEEPYWYDIDCDNR